MMKHRMDIIQENDVRSCENVFPQLNNITLCTLSGMTKADEGETQIPNSTINLIIAILMMMIFVRKVTMSTRINY